MDRTAALAQLPETYAAALRLRDEPHSDKAIAEQLGITIDAVAPLLRLATAKLDNLIATSEQTSHHSETTEDNSEDPHGVERSTPDDSP